MSFIQGRTCCPQCGNQAEFKADCWGSQWTTCLVCGYNERETLKFDAEGNCRGSRRDIGRGFGVLGYSYIDDDFFWNHFLKTPRESHDAERWLRSAQRSGAVDVDTAYVTRWNDELNQVEVLVGDPWVSSQT